MASTIKVNNIQNQCGANIANKCGSTITLGASGDTITLACGASQTGFGRTGTVNWDTTAKTASFTAVSGNGYFVNTTSGAITVTMPASPSAGDIVGIKDYAGTFQTNNCTVDRNGSNFDSTAGSPILTTNNLSVFFVYVDGTQGWKATQNDSGFYGVQYVAATGGTVTCCGDYKIHTFTGPGTFSVTCAGNPAGSTTVDYLVVSGGGGGGYSRGGGGGAGGYRESSGAASGCYTRSPLGACVSALPVSATNYPIVVGGGGSASSGPGTQKGGCGSISSFSTITSTGGGGGGGTSVPESGGKPGGSGGGGGISNCGAGGKGFGNTPPVSPAQGTDGSDANQNDPAPIGTANRNAGGGGGAVSAASAANNCIGGVGGAGATSCITASPVARGGGGGGGSQEKVPAPGGIGGGGAGGTTSYPSGPTDGVAGTTNTGGGGGGGQDNGNGGAGGSGIVIIRYKYR
jgi:hypothetical protein